MSVVRWKVKPKQAGEFGTDTGNHQLEYFIWVSEESDGDVTVQTGGPYTLGDYYMYQGVSDYSTFCKSIKAERDEEDPLLFHVTYSFERQDGSSDKREDGTPEAQVPEPWLRPPDIDYGTQKKQRVVVKAYRIVNGVAQTTMTAIKSSAGAPFATALTRNTSQFVLSVTRNELSFPRSLASAYTDSVNSDSFLDWDPGTVYCDAITGRWQFENVKGYGPIRYWRVSYKFIYDREGWDSPILDKGFVAKVRNDSTGAYELKVIADKNGVPLGREVRLDGNGAALTDQAAADVFLTWRVPPWKNFSNLQIQIPY